ncbi:MAG: MFS transporter [Polyangiaceae bacterium]|nr:MFS transporter [Polyangiaceae bacterium]
MAADEPKSMGLGETLSVLLKASRGFWLVNWVNFGDGIAYFGLLALMTLFLESRAGFSASSSTIAVSVFTGLVTLFMVLGAGALSDRLGSRRALSVAMAVVLAGRVILVLAPNAGGATAVATLAWASIAVMGFGEGVVQPAMYAGVKEYTDARTATLGYAFLYSIMNLGIVAGEAVSPMVRETWARRMEGADVAKQPTAGITGAFWFFIGVTALVLLVNFVLFTKKVERRDRVLVPAAPAEEGPRGLWEKAKALPITDLRFVFFIFVLLPVRTLFAHQWLTMPHYVTRCFPAEVGARWEWVNGLNPLIIVVAVPLLAAFTRTRRVIDMMIAGTLVSAGATVLLMGAPSLSMLLAYVVVFSLGEALWSSRFLEYVADLAPAHRVGIYMGIAGLPWFVAKTITGFYAGSLLDRFIPKQGAQAPGTLWMIHGAVGLLSPIGLLLARRWLLSKQHAAAT